MASPNIHELPTDRLATTDARGNRVYLYPSEVRGKYRTRRSWVNAILLVTFLTLPWIQIGGHPAVLLDIEHRRFALLGVAFWAHEVPLLFFVVASVILALFLVTAVWGRVWCGWGCPQTVFVDAIYRRVERWFEGDAVARRRTDQGPWTGAKVLRKSAKWSVFFLVSLVISHSFLAYFTGPEALGRMMRNPPSENPVTFLCMTGMFLAVMFDFGWFREQFCTVVCPYGRFQSVLMDEQSQAVTYQAKRGEPRRGAVVAGEAPGDCVNCYRCVQVCPTGIDIRRGLQMECIGCTACIDACDLVMEKLKKPKGLIRYAGGKTVSIRARVYGALLVAMIAGLSWALYHRNLVELSVIRAVDAPFQQLAGDRVINHFKLDLANQSFEDLEVQFESDQKLVVSNHATVIVGGQSERADIFFDTPKTLFQAGRASARFTMRVFHRGGAAAPSIQSYTQEVRLVGPYL